MASASSMQMLLLSNLSFWVSTTTRTGISRGGSSKLQYCPSFRHGAAAVECSAQPYDGRFVDLPGYSSLDGKIAGINQHHLTQLQPTQKQEGHMHINHLEALTTVSNILLSSEGPLETMVTVDSLQRLGIDYRFKEEIRVILEKLYHDYYCEGNVKGDLFEVSLLFRLLRQGGYHVAPDIFNIFIDDHGRFESYLSKDIQGVLSLFEASQLNKGEDMLYKANEFSVKHLKSYAGCLEPNLASLISHAIDHPCHLTLKRYKARHYLDYQKAIGVNASLQEAARLDFNTVQSLHQDEVKQISRWWKNLGLAKELTSARDQPIKWYLWPMAMLPDPEFSMQRVELAKVISFIYLIDDIFDVYGSLEELTLFVEAIDKWELSAMDSLPDYMKICYKALYDITNDIANVVYNKTGWDPINSLNKVWTTLCKAFLKEAKWFISKHIPTTEDYLRNGIISSGVHVVLVHTYFLLCKGITWENVDYLESNSSLIANTAKLLRLWDDLGSAKDENQEGFDGSYIDCYIQENPGYSMENARDHVMKLIMDTWEGLNKECLSPSPLPPIFVEATMNSARMVKVMYSYDERQHLPILEEYVNVLLFKSI